MAEELRQVQKKRTSLRIALMPAESLSTILDLVPGIRMFPCQITIRLISLGTLRNHLVLNVRRPLFARGRKRRLKRILLLNPTPTLVMTQMNGSQISLMVLLLNRIFKCPAPPRSTTTPPGQQRQQQSSSSRSTTCQSWSNSAPTSRTARWSSTK